MFFCVFNLLFVIGRDNSGVILFTFLVNFGCSSLVKNKVRILIIMVL